MKRTAVFAMAGAMLLAGAGVVGLSRGEISVSGQDALPGAKPSANDAAIQQMVQEEVAKQLQPAVQREVKRQLDVILARAQQEQQARYQQGNMMLNSTASTLQTLRSQIELYKIQHADNPPSMAELQDWSGMLQRSDKTGATGDDKPFGPYLRGAPMNPFSGQTAVVPAGRASPDAGWTWDPKTQELRAVISATDAAKIAALGKNYAAEVERDFEISK